MSFSCAITAGGKASRMNFQNKSFLTIDGERILDRNLKVLRPIFNDIFIITNQPNDYELQYQIPLFPDYFQNIGPLAGLHTALKHAQNETVFLLSSDLPFLDANLIQNLLESFEKIEKTSVLIPRINEMIEPLHAIYHRRIIHQLEAFITSSNSFAMRDFLRKNDCHYYDLAPTAENRRAFYNVNSPEDIQALMP
jgi:molybdopterin-guanine dinucleotide biosynthesis protein A